jgi:hypothetical protein
MKILNFLLCINLSVFLFSSEGGIGINIESSQGSAKVTLSLSNPVEYRFERLEDSGIFCLYLKNIEISERKIALENEILKGIEVSRYDPETVKMTFFLYDIGNIEPKVVALDKRITIEFYFRDKFPNYENSGLQEEKAQSEERKKDRFFLMGVGMIRFNWTKVKGNEIRFRYSDLGLPPDFSTRERASFVMDGTYGGGEYIINGQLNYDPENRITEPPLDFFVNTGNENVFLSVGDLRAGFFVDSIFPRYYHPFRGGIIKLGSKRVGVEFVGGMSRGSSEIEELRADAGAGPYYLRESPIIRGSESVFMVARSISNPDIEIKRILLLRNKDYFIDYDRGMIIFNYPLYPYDELGNPIYIVVSYQYESILGRFTRSVSGLRAFLSPLDWLTLNFIFVGDADKSLKIEDAWRQKRGIYSFGLKVDSKFANILGEFSFSEEPLSKREKGFFGGGFLNLSENLHLYFNSWKVEDNFSAFANEQLKYGYGLQQIFPTFLRTIFLSPFQFGRNLGSELYPFSLSRVSVGEEEGHIFLDWNRGKTNLCGGFGMRREMLTSIFHKTFFLTTFHDGEKTKFWLKGELDQEKDKDKEEKNVSDKILVFGYRQRLWSGEKGQIYAQLDYVGDYFEDFLDLSYDSIRHSGNLFLEYLTENEGVFAGYRKELVLKRGSGEKLLDANIYETGIRKHLSKVFFLDSRFRYEESSQSSSNLENRIISLGGGIETKQFRAMARYEIQMNSSDGREGKRRLLSLFIFGSPYKDLSINLRYYKQLSKDFSPISFSERAEEELGARILWRVSRFLSFYSQWRYDTNFELYPPLDRTRGNALASVNGLKLTFLRKMDFLSNYKLIKVWGPIENKKESFSSELGYLIWKHLRFAIGAEKIRFNDKFSPEGNYDSTVGYFKLVALY